MITKEIKVKVERNNITGTFLKEKVTTVRFLGIRLYKIVEKHDSV